MKPTLLVLLLLTALPADAQVPGPPAGGTTGYFFGPSGNAELHTGFEGAWTLQWQDPRANCPCIGTLTLEADPVSGGYNGAWVRPDGTATLRGEASRDRRIMQGQYWLPDDGSGLVRHGFFRLEHPDDDTLTGSYKAENAVISFTWSAKRKK
ncbi:MAG TPA: hypothetical protein VMI56_00960 [Reyranella sp.]|nr:hypothetical protein [Reyranella sp.]